jgi:hypothetical protein
VPVGQKAVPPSVKSSQNEPGEENKDKANPVEGSQAWSKPTENIEENNNEVKKEEERIQEFIDCSHSIDYTGYDRFFCNIMNRVDVF